MAMSVYLRYSKKLKGVYENMKQLKTHSLSTEAITLLDKLSKFMGLSKSSLIEFLIKELARKHELQEVLT